MIFDSRAFFMQFTLAMQRFKIGDIISPITDILLDKIAFFFFFSPHPTPPKFFQNVLSPNFTQGWNFTSPKLHL